MWQIKKDKKYDGLEEWAAWPKREIMRLGDEDAESIFTLTIDGSFLYSGKRSGVIELWDLDTKQKLRVLKDHPGVNFRNGNLLNGDIMSLQIAWGHLWSGATSGTVVVSLQHDTSSRWFLT